MINEVVGSRGNKQSFTHFLLPSTVLFCLLITTSFAPAGGQQIGIPSPRVHEKHVTFSGKTPHVPESIADTSHARYAEWIARYESKDVLNTLRTQFIQYDASERAVYSLMTKVYFYDKNYLVKRKDTGELLWVRPVTEDDQYVSSYGMAIQNGIIACVTGIRSADSIRIGITAYRADGTLVSTTPLVSGTEDISVRLIAAASAFYVVSSSDGESGSIGTIFKYGPNGGLIWKTVLPNPAEYWLGSLHLGLSPDGSLVIEADANVDRNWYLQGTLIAHVSPDGSVLSVNRFANDQGNQGWGDIFVKDTGTICLAGTKRLTDAWDDLRYHPLLLNYSLSDGAYSVSVPDTTSAGGLTYPDGAFFDPSGRLYYYGHINFHGAVEFVSSNHSFFWTTSLSPEQPSVQFETICSAGDGSVALAGHGQYDSLGHSHAVMALFDSTRGLYWCATDTTLTYVPAIAGGDSGQIFLGGDYTSSHLSKRGPDWTVQTPLDSISMSFNRALATDPAGNSYSFGIREATSGTSSVLAAYDPTGVMRWSTKVPSPKEPSWRTSPVKLDDEGNVYFVYAPVTDSLDVLQKMTANGQMVFAETLRTVQGSFSCKDMMVLSGGTSILLGTLHAADGAYDAVLRVSSTGLMQWIQTFPGSGDTAFHVQRLLTERNGRSYLLGYRGNEYNAIATIIALDESGVRRWQHPLSESIWYKSIMSTELTDSVIFIATSGVDQAYNIIHATVAIGFDGSNRWVTPIAVAGYFMKSAILSSGSIAMLEDGPGGALTVSVYSKNGQFMWTHVIGIAAMAPPWYADAWLTADGVEPIVIASTDSGTRIIRFDVAGNITYDLTDWYGWSSANQNTATVDAHHLLRIGTTGRYDDGYKMAIVCYDLRKHTLGVSNSDASLPSSFGLEQNYPNPFNPSTQITYTLQSQGKVTLRVYNMLGQMVANLVDGIVQEAGNHATQWNASGLASGVYYYRLDVTPNSNSEKALISVRKAILMK